MNSLRSSMDRMLQHLYPSARVVSIRRLRGGLSARVHAVRVEFGDGSRKTFVVRRKSNGTHRIPRHYRTLEVLEGTPVPAPTPVFLDMDGQFFDVPTMVIEHGGYPLFKPRDQTTWLAQLAECLYRVHQLTPESTALEYLAEPLPNNPSDPPEPSNPDALLERVNATLGEFAGKLVPLPHSLVHDDYWPGNTVWRSQRLTAIIDWDGAMIGDRRADIAQCRIDLTFIAGEEAANAFLREYEALHGGPIQDLWYFDLERFKKGHGWFERWHDGYVDIGIDWTTPEAVVAASRRFAERALEAPR